MDDRGIKFLAGPGLRVKNVAGAVIYEAIQTPPAMTGASDPLKPLTLIVQNGGARPLVRVVAGKVNASYADFEMDPQENGSDTHPFFYTPQDGDPDIEDGDSVYIQVLTSYDGFFWRIDEVAILVGVPPASDSTKWILALGVLTLDEDGAVSMPDPQQWLGNIGWARRGDGTNWADSWWLLT